MPDTVVPVLPRTGSGHLIDVRLQPGCISLIQVAEGRRCVEASQLWPFRCPRGIDTPFVAKRVGCGFKEKRRKRKMKSKFIKKKKEKKYIYTYTPQ